MKACSHCLQHHAPWDDCGSARNRVGVTTEEILLRELNDLRERLRVCETANYLASAQVLHRKVALKENQLTLFRKHNTK